MFDDPAKSYGGRLQSDYLVNYSVSGKVTSDQLDGVVYGMFTDFERGYEEHQAGGLGFLSSFSPEDLPSDHVGFWTYMNGKGLNEIPFVLGSLGEVSPTLPPFLLTGEKNCAFTPLVPEPFFGRNMIWNHVPWPDWLYITPIPSGLDTWQRH